jgi:glycosyltransferase involved in cell wall biosynthesis
MSVPGKPIVSVVVPTFRRADLLPRAIESVLSQTLGDWELIVSDDERQTNPSREYALSLASTDPRVRVLVNGGPAGQAGNLNNAMNHARGVWIKPLYDDDRLLPTCLEHMLESVAQCPGAAVARCFAERHDADGGIRRMPRGRRAPLESLRGPDALLAIFMQDVEIGTPTQLLVRRDVVQRGGWFPSHAAIVGAVDELWYTQLFQHGDLVLVNDVLAAHYQTGHATITSRLTPEAFDDEMLLLREMQYPLVSSMARAPELETAKRAMIIGRAIWRLSHGRIADGACMLFAARDRRAWQLASRWVLRQLLPGRFEFVPRIVTSEPAPAGSPRLAPPRTAKAA